VRYSDLSSDLRIADSSHRSLGKVQEHAFENLILVCANCHARITAGEIDKRAVKAYKANLSVLARRMASPDRWLAIGSRIGSCAHGLGAIELEFCT
jgi:hypothetical protein